MQFNPKIDKFIKPIKQTKNSFEISTQKIMLMHTYFIWNYSMTTFNANDIIKYWLEVKKNTLCSFGNIGDANMNEKYKITYDLFAGSFQWFFFPFLSNRSVSIILNMANSIKLWTNQLIFMNRNHSQNELFIMTWTRKCYDGTDSFEFVEWLWSLYTFMTF